MVAELHGSPAVNGTTNGLSNPTPAHPAFDSIPDVIQAFGNIPNPTFPTMPFANTPSQ
jgi:hypothetical protein